MLRLRGRVLVGPDEVRDEVWVVDGRLSFTRPRDTRTATVIEGVVLPGLVDAHCHVGLGATGPIDPGEVERQARTERDAGVLLLRDAGVPVDTRWVDDRPDLPKIIRAGRHLARPRQHLRGVPREVEPAELAVAAAAEARAGDGWVKIVADWIDRDTGDLAPSWPDGALAAAVAAAHAEGARVTAHAFAEDTLPGLVAAGIDCIEHATGLTDDTIAAVAAAGIAIVPTLVNIATFPDIAAAAEAKFPRYAAHMRGLHGRRRDTVRAAHEAGIPVYVGTDAGSVIPHGLVAREVAALVAAGLPTVDAVAAASWRARDWLGRPGLDEGAPADLVVLPDDPREDAGVLAAPTAVVLRGEVVPG